MYKSFTDMPVWQKAHNLSVRIFHLSVKLPKSEDYGLTSQIRRSSNGVSACISEGFGRSTNKDKANFYVMARGSSYETQSHLLYGEQCRYFSADEVKKLITDYDDLILELNKIIKSLN